MDTHLNRTFKNMIKIAVVTVAATGLVSCSGSDATAVANTLFSSSIGGTVTGLQGSVTLRNNNSDEITVSSSGSFRFNSRLSTGATYNVTVQTQPANQVCSVNNGSGTIASANITDIVVSCVEVVSLSGSYQAAPLIQVDSDVNDVSAAPNIDNSDFPEAQLIPNFSTVHGFATLAGTGGVVQGDRFASVGDEFDIYRVNLQQNQTLRLQVVDFAGVDVFQGDLDLALYDSGFNLLLVSNSVDEFENITVPADGDYYIVVNVYSGTSKYTLNLNGVSAANTSYQNSVRQKSMNFKAGESVIKFKSGTKASAFATANQQMLLSHTATDRVALAHIDLDFVAPGANLSGGTLSGSNQPGNTSSLNRKKSGAGFMENLKQNNFSSYQKIRTLQEIKRLNQRSDIEYVEPNYIYQSQQVPNDAFYNLQWHYPAINLPQAWDITTGNRLGGGDIIVAVVDTGIFLAHPELDGQLVTGYDFISDIQNAADGNGIDNNPDDPGDNVQLNSSSWHGTHVAGTVAAETNNASGVAGVAWSAKIMPLRVLGTQGGSSYDIIQAIRFAAGLSNDSNTTPSQIVDVINLSLGGSGFSQASQDAYNAVRAAGVIVVAAAGNENTSQFSYPASYDGVVSVSATDFINNRAPYSNFGTEIDVAAPGGSQGVDLNNDGYGDGVLSTLVDDSSGNRVGVFNFYQGTSMASPHIAGVFALMRAVYPSLTPDDVDNLLQAGSITTDLGAVGRDDIYGYGLIDALKAVQFAQQLANGGALPTQPALIVSTPNQLTLGATSAAILVLSNEGDDPASITSVTDDASWLTVVESTVDGNNLGDYQVMVDRSGLSDSSYLGTITFNLSTGASLQVQVSMTVGLIDTQGDPGTIYLLLIDAAGDVAGQVTATDNGNGVYDYSFPSVAAGSYRIVGGSDIDNDIFICQLAEACGGYPTINALSDIEVTDSDIIGLDFIVDILSNFGASRLSSAINGESTGGTAGTTMGIRRLLEPQVNVPPASSLNDKQLVQ